MNNYNRSSKASSQGNVYYVRLRTPAGVFYKLGYTTASSVFDRFSFGGSKDVDYIDKVLIFTPMSDAFQIEQKLHSIHSNERSFGKYAAIDGLPLLKNGQSELYHKDILGIDPDSTKRKSMIEFFKTNHFYEKVVKGTHPALLILVYPAAIILSALIMIMVVTTYPIIWLLDREDEKENKYIRDSKARQVAQESKSKEERSQIIKRLLEGNQADAKLRKVA